MMRCSLCGHRYAKEARYTAFIVAPPRTDRTISVPSITAHIVRSWSSSSGKCGQSGVNNNTYTQGSAPPHPELRSRAPLARKTRTYQATLNVSEPNIAMSSAVAICPLTRLSRAATSRLRGFRAKKKRSRADSSPRYRRNIMKNKDHENGERPGPLIFTVPAYGFVMDLDVRKSNVNRRESNCWRMVDHYLL